jgi:inhibitor of KinA sporulation pathway (predicted exonuclease)
MYICLITSEIIIRDYKKNRLKDELIELTSILLIVEENEMEYIEIYHRFIKPKIYINIAGECWEEKGIRLEMIMTEGISYNEFIKEYEEWICKYKQNDDILIIVTLNKQIINILIDRCKEDNNENMMKYLERNYILSRIYSEITKKKKVYNIVDILFELGLSFYIRYSGCIDDCRTMAQIIEKLYIEKYGRMIEELINKT